LPLANRTLKTLGNNNHNEIQIFKVEIPDPIKQMAITTVNGKQLSTAIFSTDSFEFQKRGASVTKYNIINICR